MGRAVVAIALDSLVGTSFGLAGDVLRNDQCNGLQWHAKDSGKISRTSDSGEHPGLIRTLRTCGAPRPFWIVWHMGHRWSGR